MSDVPPPPPGNPPPPPPPPPPPADLAPPPGYAAVTASPMSSVSLKRVGGIARAAQIVVGLTGLTAIVAVLAQQAVVDDAETYLAGGSSDEEFVESIAPYLLMSFVQVIATVASAVLVIIWLYRVAANHRTLHRAGTWGPGWAIGGWFLPPLLYVIPFLTLREHWKASDPDVPIGGDWKASRTTPLIGIWFVVYSVIPIIMMIVQGADGLGGFGGAEDDLAEQIVDGGTNGVVSAALTVAGAAVFITLVHQLTARHRRLTGEARG